MKDKDIILNHEQIQHKIKRIAYQIYETNVNEKELIIAGVENNGYIFAERLYKELSNISDIQIHLCKINIDKTNPLNSVKTNLETRTFNNMAVVVADDVLNTGTTLMYAVQHLLNVPLKRLKTTVLVNRNHKKFPIKADFKGVSLSTSSHDNVEVHFAEKDVVYLS